MKYFLFYFVTQIWAQNEECPVESQPVLDFGSFDCADREKNTKCFPHCENGFTIKNDQRFIKCRKVKQEMVWRPKRYNNVCEPDAPEVCPMPSRIGNLVEILDHWVSNVTDEMYGGGFSIKIGIRNPTPELDNQFYSVVLIFDQGIWEFDFIADTMRVSKQLKKSITLVNNIGENLTGVSQHTVVLTARNRKNKDLNLKKWPMTITAGLYKERIADASCILDNLADYSELPTIYTDPEPPAKNETCICKKGYFYKK